MYKNKIIVFFVIIFNHVFHSYSLVIFYITLLQPYLMSSNSTLNLGSKFNELSQQDKTSSLEIPMLTRNAIIMYLKKWLHNLHASDLFLTPGATEEKDLADTIDLLETENSQYIIAQIWIMHMLSHPDWKSIEHLKKDLRAECESTPFLLFCGDTITVCSETCNLVQKEMIDLRKCTKECALGISVNPILLKNILLNILKFETLENMKDYMDVIKSLNTLTKSFIQLIERCQTDEVNPYIADATSAEKPPSFNPRIFVRFAITPGFHTTSKHLQFNMKVYRFMPGSATDRLIQLLTKT